jgi:hypothetical protein
MKIDSEYCAYILTLFIASVIPFLSIMVMQLDEFLLAVAVGNPCMQDNHYPLGID